MRCNNCGFENESGIKICVKCGQPLTEQAVMGYGNNYGNSFLDQEEPRVTRLQNEGALDSSSPRKTVLQNGNSEENVHSTRIQSICPRCHYPMIGDYCGSCGYIVKREDIVEDVELSDREPTVKCKSCGKELSLAFRFCPDCGAEVDRATINPFAQTTEPAPPAHLCTLTLLREEDGVLYEGETREFGGDTVQLNRDNTDPGNRSITSKEQAVLTYEDDGWTILNRSDYGSTMVAAGRKIILQPGDIILLGNRRFRFDVKH